MGTRKLFYLVIAIMIAGMFSCKKDTVIPTGVIYYSHPDEDTINAPVGAINGLFSVNDSMQVYFSQGNLQYQASTNTWHFAEHQWDYVGTQTPDGNGNSGGTVDGSDNANASETYDGWIDLFAWGTSGFDHGAVCYHPWSTSSNYGDYYAYGDWHNNLYDQTGQADWGYNPIVNGGNIVNMWHTLTKDEWDYVFNRRSTNSGIRYAKAQVNGVNGEILLPDDWNTFYYELNHNPNHNYSSNVITASQWTTLERQGAVFLPATTGWKYGGTTAVSYSGLYGCYWSSSTVDNNKAYDYKGVSFRVLGVSVRLVCFAK